MPRPPLVVLADDLTGAAELAALAQQSGLHAALLTTPPKGRIKADVLVLDTGTRTLSAPAAARRLRQVLRALARQPHSGLFKKVDSVLRGNVLVELETCLRTLGLSRTLLVPCNPSLGRIIHNGTYFIAGRPLHRTAFARDPLHPRRTANVRRLLLAGHRSQTPVHSCHPADPRPVDGITVGEARSPAEVALWAAGLDAATLPAGGADFFRCWLTHQSKTRAKAKAAPATDGATLLLSGTASPTTVPTPLTGPQLPVQAQAIPTAATLASTLRRHLATCGQASVLMQESPVRQTGIAGKLNRLFAQAARRLHTARAFDHLLLTGGSTAESVLTALDWHRLEVVQVWGPGVVTLRPAEAPRCLVTLKPGSYAWPDALRAHFEPLLAS